MFSFWSRNREKSLSSSTLYDENTFYKALLRDLSSCEKELVIESPYITASRMEELYSIFEKLINNGVKIHIVTRDPADHEDEYMRHQATNEILHLKEVGVNIVLLRGFHHRKLAILDRKILYEGSLNILSHARSREIMRRIQDRDLTMQMFNFLNLSKIL